MELETGRGSGGQNCGQMTMDLQPAGARDMSRRESNVYNVLAQSILSLVWGILKSF